MKRPDLLTVAEAAEMLRIGPKAVYRRVKAGRITYYRPAGKILFRRADIEKLIEGSAHASIEARKDKAARILAGLPA